MENGPGCKAVSLNRPLSIGDEGAGDMVFGDCLIRIQDGTAERVDGSSGIALIDVGSLIQPNPHPMDEDGIANLEKLGSLNSVIGGVQWDSFLGEFLGTTPG